MSAPNMPVPGLYAFPYSIQIQDGMGGVHYQNCPGMTLRDYFAAAAIPEAMRIIAQSGDALVPGEDPDDAVARMAWKIADAMMKRRTTPP